MHPTVATEAELLALLPARCISLVTSQPAVPAADLPDAGKMEDLLTIARTRCQATRESSKARKQAERFDTAAWWEYGQVLDRIRTGCPHKGEWGQSLKAIGETKKGDEPNYNRAEEAIKIFREFVTKKEASKVSVRAALKRRRKSDDNYNEFADCFATPPDLWEVIRAEYNPTLDTFATPESALCRNFFCPDIEEFRNRELLLNAFAQRWTAHCPNGVAYCNPPYNFLVLGKAVRIGVGASPGWLDRRVLAAVFQELRLVRKRRQAIRRAARNSRHGGLRWLRHQKREAMREHPWTLFIRNNARCLPPRSTKSRLGG